MSLHKPFAILALAMILLMGLPAAPALAALTLNGGGGTCADLCKNGDSCDRSDPDPCADGTPCKSRHLCSNGKYWACDRTCETSTLGGSLYALFTDPLPWPLLYPLPGGAADFQLSCDQSGQPCPHGIPVLQATGTEISKSSKTITGNFTAFPSPPFKVQVAGSQYNDAIYTVISKSPTTLYTEERGQKNEIGNFTVAISNVHWTVTFANQNPTSPSYVGYPTVYFRHYHDDGCGQTVSGLSDPAAHRESAHSSGTASSAL